jgi:hypothetical protein
LSRLRAPSSAGIASNLSQIKLKIAAERQEPIAAASLVTRYIKDQLEGFFSVELSAAVFSLAAPKFCLSSMEKRT